MNPIAAVLALFSGQYAALAKWGVIALLIAGAGLTGWVKGNAHGTAKLDAYIGKQAVASAALAVERGEVTVRVVNRYIKVKGETQVVTQTVEREVIKYVDANFDHFPLSVAAVSLHNAAAINAIPDAARSIDGTASGIEAAALTKTCTENYGEYHRVANRLRALQEWTLLQSKIAP